MLALPLAAHAQQPKKIPRIGFLIATSPLVIAARIDAFKQGLRELGYVEGKSIEIDFRWADGKLDRLPALAAELVHLNVAVIVTAGPADTRAAKEATRMTITRTTSSARSASSTRWSVRRRRPRHRHRRRGG